MKVFISPILLIFIGRCNKEELRLIDRHGIVVEGTVIHRGIVQSIVFHIDNCIVRKM